MKLDSEGQRSMIVKLIDNMPMSGMLAEVNKTCVELIDLRQAVLAAGVTGGPINKITELPKK
jgi:hypothetical protein